MTIRGYGPQRAVDSVYRRPRTPVSALDPKYEAGALLDLYWIGKTMPVDPAEIACALGMQVFQAELPREVAGVLMKRVGYDPRVVVSTTDSDNRRRLAIAHELGWFVFRGASVTADEDQYEHVQLRSAAQAADDPAEIFSTRFAAELLMPESVVRVAARRMRMAPAVLAGQFGVPQEAVTYRLRDLGLTRPIPSA